MSEASGGGEPRAPGIAPELAELRDLLLDDAWLVRAVASGRQRNAAVPYRRVDVRYVDVRSGRRLQLTSYDDTQSHTRNLVPGEQAAAAVDDLLATPYASWHVETSAETVQLRFTKRGRPLLHRAARRRAVEPDRRHDRAKVRRLDASDPLFALLGITTEEGRLKPSRLPKFRQVQDLLGALDPLIEDAVRLGPGDQLSAGRPLRVVDLGCGNAYLTFGAFRYLTVVKGLPVSAIGVDVRPRARKRNDDVAARLGMADHIRFIEGAIAEAPVEDPPDLVLALHACDVATDDALARAVRWGTPVVVAAPCCHHDIQRQLSSERVPDAYRLVTRHGILKERLADVLTDALRAAVLRLVGYRVEVVEFVDSRHTPRNALIRAVRTGAPPGDETLTAYRSLIAEWGVRPALADRLSTDYPALRTVGGAAQ